MAKSKRSKVKMAYKAMRRAKMEPMHDAKLRAQAAKVYGAIGLPLPAERAAEHMMRPRRHGGSEVVSTFVPTPPAPVLNVVHGPLANRDDKMALIKPVVGFPVPGAAAHARAHAENPQTSAQPRRPRTRAAVAAEAAAAEAAAETMDVVDEEYEQVADRPYFYPRRDRSGVGIHKKRRARKPRKSNK